MAHRTWLLRGWMEAEGEGWDGALVAQRDVVSQPGAHGWEQSGPVWAMLCWASAVGTWTIGRMSRNNWNDNSLNFSFLKLLPLPSSLKMTVFNPTAAPKYFWKV